MKRYDYKTHAIDVQRAMGSLVSQVNGYIARGIDLEMQLWEEKCRADALEREKDAADAEVRRLQGLVSELKGMIGEIEEQCDLAEASMIAKVEEVSSLEKVIKRLNDQLLQVSMDSEVIASYKASEEFGELVTLLEGPSKGLYLC
ncbi:uncharacterized protein LOC141668425 [Apium graveolens]|uniref:uncharacterized protein LOC141668425 n=1 Tax=Apium graveolens TaxID=4045 RepID=UPI003D7B4415